MISVESVSQGLKGAIESLGSTKQNVSHLLLLLGGPGGDSVSECSAGSSFTSSSRRVRQ